MVFESSAKAYALAIISSANSWKSNAGVTASVLSVAAPFDSVTDADVLGAEDVVDVGIADVYDAFEVIFVGDIDGG